MVLVDPATAEPLAHQVENLPSFGVLTHMKLWYELPAGPGEPISLYSYVKRPFPVDVTRYIGIQPFLLIVRTARIVTVHRSLMLLRGTDKNGRVPADARSFQHIAEFIDSAVNSDEPLSRDVLNPARVPL